MAKQYGNTWWGKKWLDALSSIDNSNRLPRGKTYANTGKVKEINIEKQEITAKVQGSAPRPYKERIKLRAFTEFEKRNILDTIAENHFFLSKLLNREMPAELFDELQKIGIDIFPKKWQDLDGSCSCPDYAVPCKHLAAVIYMIANEIDKNPFILFELKGLQLLEALRAAGHTQAQSTQMPIKKMADFFVKEKEQKFHHDYQFSVQIEQQIDFSNLPFAKDRLMKLLDSNPLFCAEKDFKIILDENYKKITKESATLFVQSSENQKNSIKPETDFLQIQLGTDLEYMGCRLTIGAESEFWDSHKGFKQMSESLQQIPLAQLYDYCPAVKALYWIRQAAAHILAKNVFIPQIIDIESSKYIIRWIPALFVPEIKDLVAQLAALLPPNALVINTQQKPLFPANPSEQAVSLIGLFLNEFIGRQDFKHNNTEAESFFFEQKMIETMHFSQKETPQAIQKWLQKFFLQEKDFTPLLKIEENEENGNFMLSCWIEDKRDTLLPPIQLKEIFSKTKKHADIQADVLRDYTLLSEYLPDIAGVIRSKGEKIIEFDAERFVPVLLDSLPIISLLGIKVLLPKALERLIRPRPSLKLSSKGTTGKNKGLINFNNLLTFDWQVALGEQMVSYQEFQKLVKKMRGLVKINGQYVLIDDKNLADLLKKLSNPPALSSAELLQAALSSDFEGAKIELTESVQAMIRNLAETPQIPLPKSINATLRPYQQRGYEWLYKNAKLGFGSLLADDMGLGKTLQTITFLQKLKEEGELIEKKALIVLPTTLLSNWSRELAKFAPELTFAVYHGTKREIDTKVDIILTSYGVARSDEKVFDKHQWKILIIDEAQNIKNTTTAQTKAVKKLKADCLVALSGTPVENRLSEYWSIFDFANKGYLGSIKNFTDNFSKPIELERNHEKLEIFRKITAPFILRRLKIDKSIISDLPDKVEQDQYCNLTPTQSGLYQSVLDHSLKVLEGTEAGIARQGLVLQMITALKQICNHPSNYLKKGNIDAELSGKTQTLLDLLANILDAGEKVLIFTQYKEMGDLLQEIIKQRFHFEALWLHGGSTRKRRDEMVQQFQHKPFPKVMLLSLKAGGTGLNLTEANHVIHYDLWWNPAVESQATDRAFRIGQKKNVMVYRFITQATFEEKINEMLKIKRDLANLTVSAGENWIGSLSNTEIKEIFTLGR